MVGRYLSILLLLTVISFHGMAQDVVQRVDGGLGIGSSEGTVSAAFTHNWRLGAAQKFEIGLGGRLTSYLGKNQYYLTAPAIITSGQRGPQVFFIENIVENIDSVLINDAQVNALNLSFNIGYNFGANFFLGFNIDLVGVSIGGRRDGRYFEGNAGQTTTAQPTSFNILLVSDNDIGSLNSQFFGRYRLSETLGVKAGLQFLFTEYTTDTEVQQFPQPNDRFRNKSLMLAMGISYIIKK